MKLQVAHEVNIHMNGEVETLAARLAEFEPPDSARKGSAGARPQVGVSGPRRSSTVPEEGTAGSRSADMAINAELAEKTQQVQELLRRAEAAEVALASLREGKAAEVSKEKKTVTLVLPDEAD
jgi:hypothetical protein